MLLRNRSNLVSNPKPDGYFHLDDGDALETRYRYISTCNLKVIVVSLCGLVRRRLVERALYHRGLGAVTLVDFPDLELLVHQVAVDTDGGTAGDDALQDAPGELVLLVRLHLPVDHLLGWDLVDVSSVGTDVFLFLAVDWLYANLGLGREVDGDKGLTLEHCHEECHPHDLGKTVAAPIRV